jgi:hypothetical protein
VQFNVALVIPQRVTIDTVVSVELVVNVELRSAVPLLFSIAGAAESTQRKLVGMDEQLFRISTSTRTEDEFTF